MLRCHSSDAPVTPGSVSGRTSKSTARDQLLLVSLNVREASSNGTLKRFWDLSVAMRARTATFCCPGELCGS